MPRGASLLTWTGVRTFYRQHNFTMYNDWILCHLRLNLSIVDDIMKQNAFEFTVHKHHYKH